MTYRVEVAPPARHELLDLSGSVRAQAVRLIDELADNPRPTRAKQLRDKPGVYRIWLAGRWRIAYSVDDELRLIRILRIRSKDRIDYESLPGGE